MQQDSALPGHPGQVGETRKSTSTARRIATVLGGNVSTKSAGCTRVLVDWPFRGPVGGNAPVRSVRPCAAGPSPTGAMRKVHYAAYPMAA